MNIFLTDEVDTSTNYNRFISVNNASDNHVVYIFTPYVFINFHNRFDSKMCLPKALLTLTPRRVRDLFATDFFATDWRSMRLVQPLYAHIRIEDYNRRLVSARFATGPRLIGDWSP